MAIMTPTMGIMAVATKEWLALPLSQLPGSPAAVCSYFLAIGIVLSFCITDDGRLSTLLPVQVRDPIKDKVYIVAEERLSALPVPFPRPRRGRTRPPRAALR